MMGLNEASGQMLLVLFVTLCLTVTNGLRGPHHPRRSPASHHHYSPQQDVKITQDKDLLHDATHLKEDIGPMSDQLDFATMTEQEIEFYYFHVHDFDTNTKLDGLELLHAIQHTSHDDSLAETTDEDDYDLSGIVALVDRVLKEDDLDNDGYLAYNEYVLGRERDHIKKGRRSDSTLEVKK